MIFVAQENEKNNGARNIMDKDLIFESFRNCISSKKCNGCNWKACKLIQNRKIGIPVDLALAATALMAESFKKQEAVKPEKESAVHDIGSWWFVCGSCKKPIDINDNFCRHCGILIEHDNVN